MSFWVLDLPYAFAFGSLRGDGLKNGRWPLSSPASRWCLPAFGIFKALSLGKVGGLVGFPIGKRASAERARKP